MIKSIKTKWQAWLDGTPRPMFEHSEPEPVKSAASIAGRPNPYGGLAKIRQQQPRPVVREHQGVTPGYAHPVEVAPLATPKQRAYEATLPQWAREALGEMDRIVGAALADVIDATRTPQYVRRHRRNLQEALGDGAALDETTDPDELTARIIERARRASDPEITGVITTVPVHEVTEEAWA